MINDIKIGITGPISESNFGDFAMFVNNVYDLNFKNIILLYIMKRFGAYM